MTFKPTAGAPTLEIMVTLDEWFEIRTRSCEISPATITQSDGTFTYRDPVLAAVCEVLGTDVAAAMRGHIVAFRPLPLGCTEAPHERFRRPATASELDG